LEKQLLSSAPCFANTLTECQIEDLRDIKCGLTGCPIPNTQTVCNSITTAIFRTPEDTSEYNEDLCCGLTIAGLAGLLSGLVLAGVVIGIVVYCVKKSKANAELKEKM
jgi:hypothetical protein